MKKQKLILSADNITEINAMLSESEEIAARSTLEQARKVGKAAADVARVLLSGGSLKNFNLKITTHGGKLEGMRSISTYKKVCNTCKKLSQIGGSICSHCYADKYINMRDNVRAALIYNTLLLKYRPLERVPALNDLYLRIEAFSDLQSLQHLKNIYLIARKNKHVNFTLWTKNAEYLKQAEKKPYNIKIVYSSLFINKEAPRDLVADIAEKIGAPVKVFTVYDKQAAQDVKINCGGLKCINCLKCYKNYHINDIKEILK